MLHISGSMCCLLVSVSSQCYITYIANYFQIVMDFGKLHSGGSIKFIEPMLAPRFSVIVHPQVRFHNRGGAALLGQFFKNEELQRCREFDQNHKMIMEACVCTTAPYCDRFRVICRYSVETLHENACSLKIEFHIAYIKSVNSMTKVLMEKGAKGKLLFARMLQ